MSDIKVLSFMQGIPQLPGDVRIPMDISGQWSDDPEFVSGIEKLNQDVTKGMLTVVDSNYMAPGYGTSLQTLLHSRNLGLVSEDISSQIQILLGYVSQFNSDQPVNEQLVELVDLQAQEQIDGINLTLTVQTGTGDLTTIST